MAHENKVLRSFETPDGGRCVDLFVRPDGTFGFEEYRRETEDGRGWYPVGFFADGIYDSEKGALDNALAKVSWLAGIVSDVTGGRCQSPTSPSRLS